MKANQSIVFFIAQKQIKKHRFIILKGSDALLCYQKYCAITKISQKKLSIVCKTYSGNEYFCEYPCGNKLHKKNNRLKNNRLQLQIISTRTIDNANNNANAKRKNIHLVLSHPKPRTLRWVVEKITELNVDYLYPVITERSFGRKKRQFFKKRYQNISQRVAKRCGRGTPLQIIDLMPLNNLLQQQRATWQNSVKILLWECTLENTLTDSEWKKITKANEVVIFIGSEAGISIAEKDLLENYGCRVVSLTNKILSVEMAVLWTLIKLS